MYSRKITHNKSQLRERRVGSTSTWAPTRPQCVAKTRRLPKCTSAAPRAQPRQGSVKVQTTVAQTPRSPFPRDGELASSKTPPRRAPAQRSSETVTVTCYTCTVYPPSSRLIHAMRSSSLCLLVLSSALLSVPRRPCVLMRLARALPTHTSISHH